MEVERAEWKSYRIHYVHPIETGDLTAYLTSVGDERYLDLMPARGTDRGSFLIFVHGVLRVRVDADRLEPTPLSYDWFADRLRRNLPIAGLAVALDQKENALIVSRPRGCGHGSVRSQWMGRRSPRRRCSSGRNCDRCSKAPAEGS
jgi:hypothetical protein